MCWSIKGGAESLNRRPEIALFFYRLSGFIFTVLVSGVRKDEVTAQNWMEAKPRYKATLAGRRLRLLIAVAQFFTDT
jgi:hypothetical protein